jgi:protein-tyrosine phosphatase
VLDLHIHILAQIDDGPSSRDESASMLSLAASLGYSQLVATPHLLDSLTDDYAQRVAEEHNWLSPVAREYGVELKSGFEVRVTPDIGSRLECGEPITLGGSRGVLVELPFAGWPTFTDQALFDIMAAGYRPLLAHPERYAAVIENPTLIYDLHERGVLMQLTTGSLTGLFGKRTSEVSEQLLRAGLVDILASDAHSAGRRFVSVVDGLARASELVGADKVRQLTQDNPAALLADEPLPESVQVQPETLVENGWRQPFNRIRHMIPRR